MNEVRERDRDRLALNDIKDPFMSCSAEWRIYGEWNDGKNV
jgi:hypothetical protein